MSRIARIGAVAMTVMAGATANRSWGESGALREVWTGMSGYGVNVLEASLAYPGSPVFADVVGAMESDANLSSHYGQRLRALVRPTVSGEYTFWISGNDTAELWLSGDADPEGAVQVAKVESWTDPYEWEKHEGQRSGVVGLVAGRSYYIEVLHKEHSGSDHVAVAWSRGGAVPVVIGGEFLTAWGEVTVLPAESGLLVEAGSDADVYEPVMELKLGGQVFDATGRSGGISYEWSAGGSDSVVIDEADKLATVARFLVPGEYVLTLRATKREIVEEDTMAVRVMERLDPGAGGATQQVWLNKSGSAIEDLTGMLEYPLYPHLTRRVESLEGPLNYYSYYGTRTIGYVVPPVSGRWRFYLSGDDSARFSLSGDASEDGLVELAAVSSATSPGDFSVDPEGQVSGWVELEAGQRYYFELLHKEHGSSDHHAVYWRHEDDGVARVVGGEFLVPVAGGVEGEVPELEVSADYIVYAGRDQTIYAPDLSVELDGYVVKRRWDAEVVSEGWRVVGDDTGITITDPASVDTAASFPGVGRYTLRYEVVTAREVRSDDVVIDVLPALGENTGLLTREVWFNRYFKSLDELRAWPEFPDAPNLVDTLTALRGPVNWSSKYATRVTGWLRVPESGDYTFYLTGDDEAEFRIGPGEDELSLACRVPQATRADRWFDHPEQQSGVYSLVAGGRYFVELLHRETWSSDHFQVGWTVGQDREPVVIEGSYFSPDEAAPEFREEVTFYAYAGVDRTYYWPHGGTTLTGEVLKVRSSEAEVATRWEQVGGPAAVLSGVDGFGAEVVFSSEGEYRFRLTSTADGVSHSDDVVISVLEAIAGETGTILRSVWLDVSGYMIEDLLEHDPGLAYPDFEDLLPGAATPVDWAHYYGTRLAGFLHVPVAGEYRFWIASNDRSELWLSPGTDPAGAERIAYVSSAVSPGRWDYREGQESLPVRLEAGKYYLEARHKESSSGDHLALAWEGPATNGREEISRGFLSPLRDAAAYNPEIQVVLGPDRVLLWPDDTLRLTGLVYDLAEGPRAMTFRWSVLAGAEGVKFSDEEYPGTDVVFPAPGIYELGLSASDGENGGTDSLIVTVQDPLEEATGGILREVFTDLPGYRVEDLTGAAVYPDSPTFADLVETFDTPADWADHYGTRMRGYLRVPEDGAYRLYVASDDASELWFNPNGDDPEGSELVASVQYGTSRYRWLSYPSQQSEVFELRADTRYYVEALQKARTGSDHLSVGLQRGGDEEAPIGVIPGALLVPFGQAELIDEAIAINVGEDVRLRWPFDSMVVKGVALDRTPGPLPLEVSWAVTRGADGVEFSAPNALESEVRFPGPGKYTLQLTASDGHSVRRDSLVVRVLDALAVETGSILCEVFSGVSGSRMADLLASEVYPEAPEVRTQLETLEIPQNLGDYYGARIRGYLHPHASGVHRFNISGDDWAELYLSTDESPENKELVCFTPQAVNYYEWGRFPEYQVSRPIVLKKGHKYYLEGRLKEHRSRDHLAVAWHCPRSDRYEVIPGANLSPLVLEDSTAPVIGLVGDEEVVVTVDGEFVDPGITATDDSDGDVAPNVVVEHNVDVSVPGDYTVRYTVHDAAGNAAEELVRRVRVVLDEGAEASYPADASGTYAPVEWVEPNPMAITDLEAARFLMQASFGATESSIRMVQKLGYEGWIDRQMRMDASLHLEEFDRYARFAGGRAATTAGMMMPMEMMPESMADLPMAVLSPRERMYVWWTHAVKAPDQLRQRMAFALSEILVISDRGSDLSRYPRGTTNYYDMLARGAFGNYGELLEDVTHHPMMGIWLTRIRSSKESPDENYPRELMQLFSIGLKHLNQDGTLKLNGEGEAMDSYGQEVILELSRALTGWTYSGSQSFYYTPSGGVDSISPLIPFEEEHDRGTKTLLGGAVLPAGQKAAEDVRAAVENVFGHPNVAPFICRRLIQRMVTSNPSPAYLYRVAGVFNDNGRGERGDLGAVAKAILLDPEARGAADPVRGGKVKEPIFRLTGLLRGCYREPSSNPPTLGMFAVPDTTTVYRQAPLSAPTVFNFFEPDYSLPGEVLDSGLYSPEFQIVTELSAVDIANHLFYGIQYGFDVRGDQVQRIGLDLSKLESLVGDPGSLLEHVETVLVGRRLAAETRAAMEEAMALYEDNPTAVARTVLQILAGSPEFSVQD